MLSVPAGVKPASHQGLGVPAERVDDGVRPHVLDAVDDHALGRANALPQLWIYAENDKLFDPPLAQAMVGAYRAASAREISFTLLPAIGGDGHAVLCCAETNVWNPAVGRFLHTLPGLMQPSMAATRSGKNGALVGEGVR